MASRFLFFLSFFIIASGHQCFSLPDYGVLKKPDTLLSEVPANKKTRDTSYFKKSEKFYDSVYHKFSRKKITKLLYNLAFITPNPGSVLDSVQVIKSASPFEKYAGKIIRYIYIKVLPPFGSNLYDTTLTAFTWAGKTLNNVHIDTKKSIIKHNLLFKNGQPIDPSVLADNERILRDLSFIDNALILVTPCNSSIDTVDITVIAKDVWSIGFDIPTITAQRIVGRVYDANFLGMGDKLTVNLSTELNRAPFFSFDGLSYTMTNIGGSQISANVEYYANNEGDRSYSFGLERPFLTNRTKWAGGTGITWWKDVSNPNDSTSVTARYKNESLWAGRAFILKGQKETSRAVITAAVFRTKYSQRPDVGIDSNRGYYNHLQILSSLSLSRNNYYVTDYVMQFGKTENLPYGHLIQITLGWDQTDFYGRVYSGLTFSAGQFFNRFGYLSGSLSFGGFYHGDSFEDDVVKLYGWYFSPLIRTKNNRYKFRSYLKMDYRYAFNMRSNNLESYDINQDFNINKINNTSAFVGTHAISANISTICFTPWFLYGFRFALMANLQTGLVAPKGKDLITSSLFSAFGASILVKNDNLVFPTFRIAFYYYPNSGDNINPFQVYLTSSFPMNFVDFNVTAPHEETVEN